MDNRVFFSISSFSILFDVYLRESQQLRIIRQRDSSGTPSWLGVIDYSRKFRFSTGEALSDQQLKECCIDRLSWHAFPGVWFWANPPPANVLSGQLKSCTWHTSMSNQADCTVSSVVILGSRHLLTITSSRSGPLRRKLMDFRPIEWQHTRVACPKQRGDATGVP